MVLSKRTSPHVTSFIDADVTETRQLEKLNKGKILVCRRSETYPYTYLY
ncbi:MAG: hypothetical protein MZU84_07995 [Sphingobacterium sp.]|nr:hypothetical protein [Sphingobacterium sp.]